MDHFSNDSLGFCSKIRDGNLFKTLLNVNRDATREELKSSFIQLARVYHPDNNPSPDAAGKFQQLQELGCSFEPLDEAVLT